MEWFKLKTNFDDDSRFRFIETLKGGVHYALIYIKLQAIAAESNENGGVYFAEQVPYTAKTLANRWGFKKSVVDNALNVLEENKLIDIINGVIFIADWCKYQNDEKLEIMREKNRLKQQRFRERRKARLENNNQNVTVTNGYNNPLDIDIEKEIEKDLDLEVEKEKEIIEEITQSYNTATPFPKIKILSDVQKKAVLSAVGKFGLEQIIECFRIAGESEFLNGSNNNGWTANFDWIIKPENITKILNGNYSKVYAPEPETSNSCSFDTDEFIQAALRRGFGDD